MSHPYRPIASSLVRKTVLLAVVGALVVTVIQGWLFYRHESSQFEESIDDIIQANLPLLATSIWDIEPEIVQRQVDTLASRQQFSSVRVRVNTGQVFTAGQAHLAGTPDFRSFDIPYPTRQRGRIGTLEVTINQQLLHFYVLKGLIGILIGYFGLTGLICLLIHYVLRRDLQQPMTQLAKFASGLKPGTLTEKLDISHRHKPHRDEIDLVAEGFGALQESLNSHIQNLDVLVAERTGELAGALEAIRELSVIDYLSGCYNRGYLDEKLPPEMLRAERYERKLSVAFLDIDHFKKINDTYGHATGDEVIRLIAKASKNGLREGLDWLSRYGGEEFVIVLPETGLAEACGMIERLRGKLESTVILYQNSAISITASFGVAEFVYGESFADLLARADTMLYQAKQSGRNRVCHAG